MSQLQRRVTDLEERKAFQDFLEDRRKFNNRSELELQFFAVHGYFPENAGDGPFPTQDFTIGGLKTTITIERVSESDSG